MCGGTLRPVRTGGGHEGRGRGMMNVFNDLKTRGVADT